MNQYEEQANKFLHNTGTSFSAQYLKHDRYFVGDTDPRDIYEITLVRNGNSYVFRFGQSTVNKSKIPSPYDVLACLQKYEIGTLDDFARDSGFDFDNIKPSVLLSIYYAVKNEWQNVQRLFHDVLNELREIN